ncbi:C40 family peptidase [Luteimonas sp. S4-F44]|uniref:NlpC/P60 family protein n=1 Tax=Luteimonas sp. S4-F44 TaxID=2925842 RepID=UPI001F534777|nr:NlpC/P60 family protein [Luteimonas sp. S4-F44]UNK43457.1 C40 family peptidase [Luteimonas sp. S4-F44]
MQLADVERLVGVPYCADTLDCADFVVLVQRELFGRDVVLPDNRPRGARGQVALGELSRPYGHRTEEPADGDLVVMFEGGRPAHVGVYLFLAHEGWVLHSCEQIGESVCHRVRELPDWGAPIEGFYKWV